MKDKLVMVLLLLCMSFPLFAADRIVLNSEDGNSEELNDSNGSFRVDVRADTISIRHTGDIRSSFFFQTPKDKALTTGAYTNAQSRRDWFRPGMRFFSDRDRGRSCGKDLGSFYIHELDTEGESPTIALDFTFTCNDSLPIQRGAIRINSTIPAPYEEPIAVIAAPTSIVEGDIIFVDARSSIVGGSKIDNVSWRQISGPDLLITDPQNPSTTMELAKNTLIKLGGESIVLELNIVTESGKTSSTQTTILVKSKSDPLTF